MFKSLYNTLRSLLGLAPNKHFTQLCQWQENWSVYLSQNVDFYRLLSAEDKKVFEQRIQLFWQTTVIEGSVDVDVSDEDRLLVAAAAIIPVWAFPGWHYFNLKTVFLLPAAFNHDFICAQPDSLITGMVGTGPMAGKMALSQPDLHAGFNNSRDKKNVGIHEFVHLVDMADGNCDGFPERLKAYSFAIPWLDFVGKKIKEIDSNQSNINAYGATNDAEFFAVASEYFFERPVMLKKKHPQLYEYLSTFYQQNLALDRWVGFLQRGLPALLHRERQVPVFLHWTICRHLPLGLSPEENNFHGATASTVSWLWEQ